MSMMKDAPIHVVAGVITFEQQVLIAQRPKQAHQGGLWEFPGGKVEQNENALAALIRELQEELGIAIIVARPLIQVHHDYPDKSIFLDVFWIDHFEGIPQGCEGQRIQWIDVGLLSKQPFPAANQGIVTLVQDILLSSSNFKLS